MHTRVGKGVPAELAHKRARSRMRVHVIAQFLATEVGLRALSALVPPVPTVDAEVLVESGLIRECFGTLFALVRTISGVRELVNFEAVFRFEELPAEGAGESRDHRMQLLVCPEERDFVEDLGAGLALEGALRGWVVDAGVVTLERAIMLEHLPALVANVQLFTFRASDLQTAIIVQLPF